MSWKRKLSHVFNSNNFVKPCCRLRVTAIVRTIMTSPSPHGFLRQRNPASTPKALSRHLPEEPIESDTSTRPKHKDVVWGKTPSGEGKGPKQRHSSYMVIHSDCTSFSCSGDPRCFDGSISSILPQKSLRSAELGPPWITAASVSSFFHDLSRGLSSSAILHFGVWLMTLVLAGY